MSITALPPATAPTSKPSLRLVTPTTAPQTLAAGLTCRIASGDVVEHANLDHGASTPALVAVKQAVEDGQVTRQRYESYKRLRASLEAETSRS